MRSMWTAASVVAYAPPAIDGGITVWWFWQTAFIFYAVRSTINMTVMTIVLVVIIRASG